MKSFILSLYILLIVLLLVTLFLFWQVPPQNLTGSVDVQFPSLQRSGAPVADYPPLKWGAFFFGVAIIGLFCRFVQVGAYKHQPAIRRPMYRAVGVGIGLYMVVYTGMVSSWWEYERTPSFDYVVGLPKPTAWLFLGLMTVPAFLSFLYIRYFKTWIYTDADDRAFREIVRRRQNRSLPS